MKKIETSVNPKKYARYKSPKKLKSIKNAKDCKLKPYSIKYNFPKEVKLTIKHWIFAPGGIIDNQNRLLKVRPELILQHEKLRKDKKLYQRREKIRNQNRKLKLLKSFDAKLYKFESKEIPDIQTLCNWPNIPMKIDVYYRGK